MARYKLLAGLHIQDDPDWKPTRRDQMDAERTGLPLRAPSRTYRQGEIVESDTDLVDRFGAQKFVLVSGQPRGGRKGTRDTLETPGDVTGEIERDSPSVAPQGQVSTGKQVATSLESGATVSGPSNEDRAALERRATEQGKTADRTGELGPRTEAEGRKPDEGEEGEEEGGAAESADLDSLTVEDLRTLARDEEVNLRGASTKADIIKEIKKSRRGSR